MKYTFDDIEETGLTKKEIMEMAREYRVYMRTVYAWRGYTLQMAIDAVIDAEADYMQETKTQAIPQVA
jgi:anaerobic selenocysteine-containing dehydrogenase